MLELRQTKVYNLCTVSLIISKFLPYLKWSNNLPKETSAPDHAVDLLIPEPMFQSTIIRTDFFSKDTASTVTSIVPGSLLVSTQKATAPPLTTTS